MRKPLLLAAALLPVLSASLLPEAALARPGAVMLAQNYESRIDRLDVMPPQSLMPGEEIAFTLYGTPGARASVSLHGAGRVWLEEVNPGVYQGTYTLRRVDHMRPDTEVRASLRVPGSQSAASTERPLYAQAERALPPPPMTTVAPPDRYGCPDCGVVVAINPVAVRGEGGALGTIVGGVAGGLLGSQVGGGRGRTAAEIAGAVGGAYAGNQIQANNNSSTRYEAVIRFNNGTEQGVPLDNPSLRVGDHVRVHDGRIELI